MDTSSYWWEGDWKELQWYEGLSEKQKDRLIEVQDFLGNNCLGWCQGGEQISKAVIEVLCRLPDNAAEALLCNSDVVVIDGSTSCAWSWRHACPPHEKALNRRLYVIVLRAALREMPYKAVVAEVAHEFAHVFREHGLYSSLDHEAQKMQEEADTTIREWGFGEDLDLLNS
ncbi:hypothetical protein ACFLWG_02075 [Chloroflexota bacterium]